MDDLLEFDNQIDNGIDWLHSAWVTLSTMVEGCEGKWEKANQALEKLNVALALLREVRTPLQKEIQLTQEQKNRENDMADTNGY